MNMLIQLCMMSFRKEIQIVLFYTLITLSLVLSSGHSAPVEREKEQIHEILQRSN